MRVGIKKLGRVAALATALVAASSMLEATGQPLLATLGQVAFNLAAGFSEGEQVRRRMVEAAIMETKRRRKGIRCVRFERLALLDALQGSTGFAVTSSRLDDMIEEAS
jgi:hypothetical protein